MRARWLLDRLRRALRRRAFAFDAERLGPDGSSVLGGRQIQLVPRGAASPQGWVRIRMQVATPSVLVMPRLCMDASGARIGEATSIRLGEPIAGRIDAIGYLPVAVRSLALDPGGRAGDVRIEGVTIQELSEAEALVRLLARSVTSLLHFPRALVGLLRAPGMLWVRLDRLQATVTRGEGGASGEYGCWIERYDTLLEQDRVAIRRRIEALPRRPLISVIMPVHDVKERWLRCAIDSVRTQLYPDWELCIADDASRAPHVRRVLEEYAAREPRIKVVFREKNGHISAASNSALGLASGEYVAFLDNDDELPEHALYMIAEEVCAHPDAAVVYSDEDKIDEEGRRHEPYFKPDWCPDLFLSHNLISHLSAYRRDLVERIGGLRTEFDGSQDYDLALRAVEGLAPGRVRHIPHILYHWRALRGSTASGIEAKPYCLRAARDGIRQHLERRGLVCVEVTADYEGGDWHRVRYPLPVPPPLVTIIVPTRDREDLLRPCLESLLSRTDYASFEVLVMDNGSVEPAAVEYLRRVVAKDPRVRVVRWDRPYNFQAINNEGARLALGTVLVMLNNDTEVVDGGWLRELVSHAVRPEIGAVGAMLRYPDGSVQHAGVVLGMLGGAGHIYRGLPRGQTGYFGRTRLVQNWSAVTAACLAVRRSVWGEVGGLEEAYPVAFGDVDFCLKVRARGYRNLWTPYAELLHHESKSRGSDQVPERRDRAAAEVRLLWKRWRAELERDPCYSPNLSLESTDCALAFPPRAAKPWRAGER